MKSDPAWEFNPGGPQVYERDLRLKPSGHGSFMARQAGNSTIEGHSTILPPHNNQLYVVTAPVSGIKLFQIFFFLVSKGLKKV